MKIALLNWPVGRIEGEVFGGVETTLVELKKGLAAIGNEVQLYGNTSGKSKYFRHIKYNSKIPYLNHALYAIKFLMKTHGADIWHFHNFPIGVLFQPDRSVAYCQNELHLDYHRIFWKRYNRATFVFCSDYIKNKTLEAFPKIRPKRCLVIHNAVDTTLFCPGKDKRPDSPAKIIFVGQWNKKKGLDVLLHAARLLHNSDVAFELKLVGGLDLWSADSPETAITREALREMLNGLSNVRLLGKLSQLDVARALQESSIAVVPSVWQEPFGITAIEAMASGLPVVVTKVGGLQEIVVDGESGLLVKPGDPLQLAQALERLIKEPDTAMKMGKAARERVENNFSRRCWLEKINNLHNEILTDSRKRQK
jgi:glycosyltransferase involved in cell wall biosynthesis